MEDQNSVHPGIASGIETGPGGNPLGFSLEFRENAALVTLTDRLVADTIRVHELTLEVPGVRFPFDVTGGAEQFRHHRCRLRTLVMSVDQEDLQAILMKQLDPARYGFERIRVSLQGGLGCLSGRYRVGSQSAPFTARFVVEPGADQSIRIGFMDIRLYGWMPVPATSLLAQLARALKSTGAEQVGAAFLVFHPVRDLVRWLLPVHGWKIPELSGLRVDRVDLEDGRLRLVTARFPDELPSPAAAGQKVHGLVEQQYLVFKEGCEAYQKAEKALREGQLDKARKLYLGKGGVEPAHPHAARRMLEIAVVRPDRFDEVQDLVQDLLSKDENFLPALFSQAAMQVKLGEPAAGRTYETIGRIEADRSEREDAVMAHLEAGFLLKDADPTSAIRNYERALELDPNHLGAMHILCGLYEDQGQWYRALRMNLRLARRLEEPDQIAACHLHMGLIFLNRFDDLDKARKHLDAALTHHPENLEALSALATVQQRRNRPTRAAKLLQKLAELADPGADQSLLLDTRLRLATLWEEDLADPESALLHYEQVLQLKPDHLHSLFRTGTIAAQLQRWDQASESFSRLLDLQASGMIVPADVVKAAALHLGRIYLDRPDGNQEARSFLQRAASMEENDLTVWIELEKLDRKEKNWEGLVQVLEHKARLITEPGEKLATILEAARIISEKLGKHQDAEEHYRNALQVDAPPQEAIDGLRALLEEQERWEELADLLAEVASTEPEPAKAAAYWSEVGRIRLEKLESAEGGQQALEMAVQSDPSDRSFVQRLLHMYRDKDKAEEIVDLIGRLDMENWNDDERVDLLLERAGILAGLQGRVPEAIEGYRLALKAEPGLLQAHRALADLYHEKGMWAESRESISKVLELAGEGGLSAPGRTDLHRRLADIELRLDNREAAIEQLRMVLSRYEEDNEAVALLGQLLREDERWEELAAFYAQRAERAEGEDAAALHTAAATIWWERLRKLEPAAAQYHLGVEAAPNSKGAAARLASLQRVYAGLGAWDEVVWVIRERISLSEPSDQVAMFMALASILSARLDDADGASECWQSALEIDPDYRPALLMLARRKFVQGNYPDALDLGIRALKTDPQGVSLPLERRAAVALDCARAAWTLERLDDSARMYLEHMEVFSQRQYAGVELEALERLELLLRKQNRYEDLALLYRRWLSSRLAVDREGGLRRSLALLLFEHLDQPDEAIEVLSEQVQSNPDDQSSVSDLMRMLRKASRWERLASLLDSQWERASREEERFKRLEDLAEIYQFRLHEPDEAINRWRQLLDLGYELAAERLSVLFRQEGMHQELSGLLESLAERADDPVEAIEHLNELAVLAVHNLRDFELALHATMKVYSIEPSAGNQEKVLQLLRDSQDQDRLVDFLSTSASDEESSERRMELLLEHADLCFGRANKPKEGLYSLRQAIDIEPSESLVRRALEAYEHLEDWESTADMMEMLVDLAEEGSTAARRVYRLGLLFLQRLDSPDRAIAAFEMAHELDPKWIPPLNSLSDLFAQREAWARLIEIKQKLADGAAETEQVAGYLRQAADLAFDKLDDHDRGLALLSEAIEMATDPVPLLNELADRCEALGEYEQAAEALERVVAASSEIAEAPHSPAALHRRIADLRMRGGDHESAIDAFEQTLRQEPSDEETATSLEELYRASNRHADLAQMMEGLANRKAGEDAADLWLKAARSWLDAEDSHAAEVALDRAVRAWPDHAEASILVVQLFRKREAWAELLDFLDGLSDKLLSLPEVIDSAEKCWEHIKSEPEHAAQELAACQMMLRLNPEHLDALWRTAHLLRETGEAGEAEAVLRKLDAQAEKLDADQRYSLDESLARIDFSRGRTEDAEERLKRCIEARPEESGPRTFLHKLYAGGKRYAERVALLLDESERAAEEIVKVERLSAAAEIMEKELGDPKGAVVVYERALETAPDNIEIWHKLVELHRLLDNPEGQRRALLRVADLSPEDEQHVAIRKATRLAHEVIRDLAAAREGWSLLLKKDPENIEALDRLLDLDREEENHQALVDHLELRVEATEDPAERFDLLSELAGVWMRRLNRPVDALAVFEQMEQLRPRDTSVLSQLSELYRQLEKWDELAGVLGRSIEFAGSDKERARLYMQLAELQNERLDQREAAIESTRKAAALDPSDLGPLENLRKLALDSGDDSLLCDTLESLATKTPDASRALRLRRSIGLLNWKAGQKEDAKRAFAKVLQADPDDAISHRFLADILQEQESAESVPHIRWLLENPECLHPGDQIELKQQLVKALQSADAGDRIPALEDLLETSPDNLEAARQLIVLYKESGNQRARADLLLRLIDRETDDRKADLWMQRAEILLETGNPPGAAEALSRALSFEGAHQYQVAKQLVKIQIDDLKDQEAAAVTLETILRIKPDDVASLGQLSDLCWHMGRWSRAEETTRRLLESAGEEQAPGLWLRLGDIHLREGTLEDARMAFEKALSLDPDYRSAYQRLEEVFKTSKDDQELADFYLRWARSEAAGSQRVTLFLTAARHLERTGNVEGAIAGLREAVKIDPSSPEAYESLAPLLSREGQWEELVVVLKQRRELAQDAERRLAFSFEIGEICKEHLDDLVQAAVHFEYCLQIDPDHVGAIEELADIRYGRQLWKEAGELYSRLGERGLSASRFVAVFRRGEIAEALSEPQEAIEHYRRSIELNATFLPSRQNLIRLLGEAGQWEETAEAIEGILDVLPDDGFDDLADEYKLLLAETNRRLLRFEQAAEYFRDAYERNPDNMGVVKRLKEFYTNSLQWEQAAAFSKKEIELTPVEQQTAGQWEFLGDLYSLRLGEQDKAQEAYREAARLEPRNLEPKWKLWKLLRSSSGFEEMQQVGPGLLECDLGQEQRAQVHRALGRIRLASGDTQGALDHFEEILAGGEADLEFIEEVASLSREEGRWARYCSLSGQALEVRIANGLDPEDALESYLKLAGVYQEQLKDIDKAAACIRRALELHPRDPELLRRLGNLYASDWETYREAIEVFRELVGMDPTDSELYRYLARLEAARGDVDRTACYYSGLRFLAPMDKEARKFLEHAGRRSAPSRPLDRSEWDEVILHPAADCLLQRILSVLAPYLEKLFPADPDWIESLTRITRESHPDVIKAAEQANWLVSGRPFDIYLIRNDAYRAWCEAGDQPGIILSSAVIEKSTPTELQFFLTREIVNVAMGFVLPLKLRPKDTLQLLAILCKMARPEAEPPHPLPATAPQYLQAMAQVIPADVLEMVIPLVRRYALEPRAHDLERWRSGVRRTADRVALLNTGDLISAMSVLARFSEAAGGRDLAFIPDRSSVLTRDKDMIALFRFTFSEQFLKLRKALGAVVSRSKG